MTARPNPQAPADPPRWRGRVRAVVAELLTPALDPLPSIGGRFVGRLPHVGIVLLAIYLYDLLHSELTDDYAWGATLGTALTVAQVLSLPLALWAPVPAWWLTTVTMVITAEDVVNPTAAYPWPGETIAIQAGVLLLLALRSRASVAVTATLITLISGFGCAELLVSQAHRGDANIAGLVLAIVTVVGAALRSSRVARSRLLEQELATAQERTRRTLLEERGRIARELHDVVAHHMSVVSIQSQVTPHLVPDPPAELTDNAAAIRWHAVTALAELRRVLGVLRSSDPDDATPHEPQPSVDRIGELADRVRTAGLDVGVEVIGDPFPVPDGVGLSAFRIVQEGLSNALRHAPGSTVTVTVTYSGDRIGVVVANTPPTGEPEPSSGAGHGVTGMRERAAMLGGELSAGPTADGGYRVAAELPVSPPANRSERP